MSAVATLGSMQSQCLSRSPKTVALQLLEQSSASNLSPGGLAGEPVWCCCLPAGAAPSWLAVEHTSVPVQDAISPLPRQRYCRRLLRMNPMSTTSTAQARIPLRLATAVTMCQQGRPMSPPPSTHTVSIEPSLHPPSMLVSAGSARRGYTAPTAAKVLAADALSSEGRCLFLVVLILLAHLE